jgi:DNA-binding response OmpR family regulator
LTEHGYVLDSVDQGDDALHMLRVNDYAVAVIDWRMPGMDGDEVIRTARTLKIATPVLMLTARDTTADRVAGLDAGADDYLVKPFQFDELLARLRSLQRRPHEVTTPTLEIGRLALDPGARRTTVGGSPLILTAIEFSILELLMRRSPAVVERLAIARHVWRDEGDAVGSNTVDVHIANLRRKLEGSGVQLETARGLGFRVLAT